MSLVLNMIGGGGSFTATDAILRVQAPLNSIVTITKGSVTKTDLGHENADRPAIYDYYFIIHQSQFDSVNAWTITATKGTDTNSTQIIVNASDEYDVLISYNVPLDVYQSVEYLQSSGSQRIVTGLTNVDGAEFEFQYLSVGTYNSVFGARDTSSSANRFGFQASTNELFAVVAPNNVTCGSFDLLKHKVTQGVKFSNNVTFDGVEKGTGSGSKSSKETAIFCERYSSNWDTYSSIKLFYIKLYKGQTLEREMYPCYRLSDSVAGLYDKANNTFYTNSGTGTFTVGPDV